jgi:hypothetical protein
MNDMDIGEYGQINDDCSEHHGDLILRTYSGWVSLTNPRATWSYGLSNPEFKINILPINTRIEITV